MGELEFPDNSMEDKLNISQAIPDSQVGLLDNVVQSVNVWISFTDNTGAVLLWNHCAERVSGYSLEEISAQDKDKIIYPDAEYRQKIKEYIENTLAEEGLVRDYSTTITSKDGTRRAISWSITPWSRKAGENPGYLQVGMDMTEIQEAHEHIKGLNKLLEAFYAISQQIVMATDVEALMRGACESLVRTKDYVLASFTLVDDHGHPVDTLIVGGEGFGYDQVQEVLLGFDRQPIAHVIRTQGPFVCQDIYVTSDFEQWFRETRERGISAFTTVPMGVQGTVIGALTLYSCKAYSIDQDELSLLQGVANDLAYAIQSIRMRDNLKALEEVSLSVTDTQKLGTTFDKALNACMSLTRASSGFVVLEGEAKSVVAESGERILFPGDTGSCSIDALIEDVLRDGEPIIRNDCASGFQKDRKSYGRKPLSSLMLIPMLVKGSGVGVIGLGNCPGGFSKSNLSLCFPFAAQLAMAVKKTQLFTEINIALGEAKENAFRFRTIFETAADLIMIVDASGIIQKCNSRLKSMLGYSAEELEGESIDKLVSPEDAAGAHRLLEYTYRVGCKYNEEYRFVNAKGLFVDVEINSAIIKAKDVDNVIMLVRDITERKKDQEQLKYLTLHDPMTGLYNRRCFEEELARLDVRRHGPITVISCDVDGLKLVNDTLGHQQGDALIKAAAAVIKKPFRSCDVVARIGGDEFAVILPHTNEENAQKVRTRILDAIEAFNSGDPEIPLSLSVGIATSNSETSIEKLFHQSDNAMYRHKASRGNRSREAIVKTLMLALGEKDYVSRGHVERVRDLAIRFGEILALSPAELDGLDMLAQVHDIGKIGLSESILSKRDVLTEEERKEVQKHSELGYRLASSTPELSPVADSLMQHHEWWNGQGYPNGLSGENILLQARLFAIVDAYDAMTSYRPYREPFTPEEALQELRNGAGLQFDPQLVVIFENMLASLAGI